MKCIPTGMRLGNNTLQGTDLSGLDLTSVNFPAILGQPTDPNTPTIFANTKLPYAATGLNWSWLDLTGATVTRLPTDVAGAECPSYASVRPFFRGL